MPEFSDDPAEAMRQFMRRCADDDRETEKLHALASANFQKQPAVTYGEVRLESTGFVDLSADEELSVSSVNPVALRAIFLWHQYNGGAVFDGTVSTGDDADPIVGWLWDLGDGNTAGGSYTTHFYDPGNPDYPDTPDPAGTYPFTVTLQVTTASGATASVSGTVTLVIPQPDLLDPVVHRIPP